MRLLTLKDGEFSLTKDLHRDIPPYAILSHTWGKDEEEVTFKDVVERTGLDKTGFRKIRFCGEQADRDGLQHFWVDTCCIDKQNSAELAEAINSMYRWYQKAHTCYVYLSDVSTKNQASSGAWESAFRRSRWFTRGWTLQELIAPPSVEFFSSECHQLGDKKTLERQLHEITGIPVRALRGAILTEFSADERMSWAKNRQTTREEDQAYCLQGILNIFMPPLYGEGRHHADKRLRTEIQRNVGGMLSSEWPAQDHKMAQHEPFPTVPLSGSRHFIAVQADTTKPGIERRAGAAIRLVHLFSACLQALDQFMVYREFGADAHHLETRFVAEKFRFEQWGMAVGFQQGKFFNGNDSALEDPQALSGVEQLLSSIKEICSKADDAFQEPKLGAHGLPRSQTGSHQSALPQSKKSRFRDKVKYTAQVELLGKLVRRLQDLVPLNGSKNPRLERRGPMASHDAADDPTDDRAWATEFQQILVRIEREMEAETRRTVSAWLLGGYTPNGLYEDSAQKRVAGTCDWILDRPEFRSWVSPDFPAGSAKLLWIHGPAGFGKTILCSRVVERLPSEIGAPIAHFFFSSDFESRRDPYIAIRSWIFQVILHPKAFDVVYEEWEAQYGRAATQAHVVTMFHDVAHAIPECTFVLDGLDECSWTGQDRWLHDKDPMGAFLNTITRAVVDTKTRIMVVSRDEPRIRRGLPSYVSEYKISSEDVRPDTESYARSIVDRKLSKKSEATKNDLALRMAGRCNGQFLWLKMQDGSLDSWMSKKALTEVIDETPAGLEHLYDRNWDDILRFPRLKRSRAFDLLRWAAFALRPLTVCEMIEVLLVNDECDNLPVDEIPDTVDEDYVDCAIIGLCGSLLEVRGNSSEPHVGCRTVHLAHFSVRQYFVSKMSAPASVLVTNERLRSSNEAIQSGILGRLCLRYLSFRGVWQEPLQAEASQVKGSFRDYAAGFWYRHATVCEPIDADTVCLINTFFDSSNSNWDAWRAWFDQNDAESDTVEGNIAVTIASPLYYASRLGLVETVRKLAREPNYIVKENAISGRTALGAACSKGHMGMVHILLQAGASIAQTDNIERTPLYLASWKGHDSLLKLLLQKGADVAIPNKYGVTSLNSASGEGHVDVVRLLLEKGADITVPDIDGWTPLNSASRNG
ncbi:hypothetical protein B0T26DRAFT_856403, partial [Lasiosphaeria miniovina]